MEQFMKTMLILSLAGTLASALLMTANRLLSKRIYSGFVYYAWMLVLLRFVLPVPGLLHMPAPRAVPEPAAVVQTVPAPEQRLPGGYVVHSYTGASAAGAGESATEENIPSYSYSKPAQARIPAETSKESAKPFPFWPIALCVWAAGAVGSAAWSLCGYYSYRRALYATLRPAEERDMRVLNALHPWPWPVLYRSAAVSTPLLMGPVRPVIILPDREYTPAMLDGILRHELTHYRRGDLIVKWFAAAVCCVHWFNPIVYMLRPAIDRACELSCDEQLLRTMNREEKQNYGELLLALAARTPLPRRVVAVSFATEKRNLKERLVQIMTFRKKGYTAIAIMLSVLVLLVGCATAAGPGKVPVDPSEGLTVSDTELSGTDIAAPVPGEAQKIYVDNVDDFLAALGSDRTVILRDGTYDLSKAKDYGKAGTDAYMWSDMYDGYELQIFHAERLSIVGENGAGAVSIVAEPRYANVLYLEGCRGINIDGITAGHTPEPGECSGGVVYCDGCEDISIDNSVLFGCGTMGITAVNSRSVFADGTTIKECSYGAIEARGSYDVRFTNGKIFDCGLKGDWTCFDLLAAHTTTGFAVHNTEIYGNKAMTFLNSNGSNGVQLRGCRVHDNRFDDGIAVSGKAPMIDGTEFKGNIVGTGSWYPSGGHPAEDASGAALTSEQLYALEYAPFNDDYSGPEEEQLSDVTFTVGEDGRKEYHVTNVDDFLGVIGSNRVIYLEGGNFDLSSAGNYGGYGGTYYCWEDCYDGPGLVITGVENLTIIGNGAGKTTVETLPRYADVLAFSGCRNVTVKDLTAGHVKGAGSCSGDVISFDGCSGCTVDSCGLFGCGVNGVVARSCVDLTVMNTEIYECSGFGAVIEESINTAFEGCTIRDCGSNKIFTDYSAVYWNKKLQDEAPEMFTDEWE